MRFYTILLLLAGYLVLPSTFAATNCLSYLNKSAAAWLSYRYDTINAFFKDDQGIEHQVDLHRVLNAEQQILHVDFDFFANETIGNLNKDAQLHHVAWAFRQAVVNQQLYTKRWRIVEDDECDRANQVCCKDGFCNDLNSVPVAPDSDLQSTSNNNNSRPGRPGLDLIPIMDSAINLRNHYRTLRNGNQTVQHIAQNQQAPTRFHFTGDRNRSTRQVCMMGDDGFCETLNGNVTAADTFVSGSFSNIDQANAMPLSNFLYDYYNTERSVCSVSMNCHGSGAEVKCSVSLRCDKN